MTLSGQENPKQMSINVSRIDPMFFLLYVSYTHIISRELFLDKHTKNMNMRIFYAHFFYFRKSLS